MSEDRLTKEERELIEASQEYSDYTGIGPTLRGTEIKVRPGDMVRAVIEDEPNPRSILLEKVDAYRASQQKWRVDQVLPSAEARIVGPDEISVRVFVNERFDNSARDRVLALILAGEKALEKEGR